MKVYVGRRYRFPASHRLHTPALSDEENRATYGKCNNPHGHGHNYEVEVTVGGPVDASTGRVVSLALLDRVAEEQILRPFSYRNLNAELKSVPTTENLASEIMGRLREVWLQNFGANGPALRNVRIWETDRNICEVENNVSG